MEFKATHTYDGGDDGVIVFMVGEPVRFIRACDPDECFGNGLENGLYENEAGETQYVYLHCVSPVFAATHRYNGQDTMVFFREGELVQYIGEYDGGSDAYNATIGNYQSEDGTVQGVLRSCMVAL